MKKFNLNNINKPISPNISKNLFSLISQTYQELDEYNYTLERSLTISAEEMNKIYKQKKNTFNSRIQAIIKAMPDIMFLNDEDGKFLEVFVSNDEVLSIPKEFLLNRYYNEIFPVELASFFHKSITKAIQENKLNVIEYDLKVYGKKKFYEARIMPVGLSSDNKQTVIVIARDITKSKKIENRLKYIATHDSLTKLPNRYMLQESLKKTLAKVKEDKTMGALFFLDIDRFKEINDNLGHDIGDSLLVKSTKRLRKVLCRKSILARFGGDEFVLLVENISSKNNIEYIAKKIMNKFNKPFKIDKYLLDITISVGISIIDENSKDITQLIKYTDIAMYHAKALGRNNYQFFTKELEQKAYEKFIIEVNLKNAIAKNEFYILYQPQVRLKDNKIVGLEALLRWNNSEFGILPPNKFITIAEKCGFIESITNWVIDKVCQQIQKWDKDKYKPIRVSINLSRKEIGKSDMVNRVLNIVDKYHIKYNRIEFEVTESGLLRNELIAFKNIRKLRLLGFIISIDDFGTGYSSLSNLKDLLFDKLKIDRSFIKDMFIDRGDQAIIKATIALAKSMSLKVIAEGVETQKQLKFLLDYGCDEMQGYLYSPPIQAEIISKQFLSKL
ncbi:MAG: EAL domain-containing protein [Sulfurovaceae bacterium]|nr:EAL domain-containing protein [Sulfurovaceae bacterium]